MATYKVIQDIEAEDHILGPLSLRQFIYGLIAAFFFYLCFISIAKHVAFLLVLFLPPGLFCAFFAFPFGRDQPTEIWALAKIRFLFKPRKRIWNQSGVKEQVTITVPKKIEVQLTDGLSQVEVKSRLRALADTIDSRGWAVKNVAPSPYTRPNMLNQDSERLLSIGTIPQPVADIDAEADILDEQYSPIAQQFTSMIDASNRNHRQQLIEQLNTSAQPAPTAAPSPQWFTGSSPITAQPAVVTEPTETTSAQQIKQGLAAQAQANARLRTVSPTPVVTDETPAPIKVDEVAPAEPPAPVTPQPDPAILNLAHNNDLNVATLARQANKAKGLSDDDEVVISLH